MTTTIATTLIATSIISLVLAPHTKKCIYTYLPTKNIYIIKWTCGSTLAETNTEQVRLLDSCQHNYCEA